LAAKNIVIYIEWPNEEGAMRVTWQLVALASGVCQDVQGPGR
jgi:hypothetical protein